jgi:predicted dienelactone hydrolase
LIVDRDDLQPVADPRVHALMLMAPLSLKFGRHTPDVHVPVLLYSGDGDNLVPIDKNAVALARKLPVAPDSLLAGQGTLYSWHRATTNNRHHAGAVY